MANDIFDYNDWDGKQQKSQLDHAGIDLDLEEDPSKQRRALLAQQWRDGELFVATDVVCVYEKPADPSPIIDEFASGTIMLLSSLKASHNYGGFRELLLPIRGWIWTSLDEYDRAFLEASHWKHRLNQANTREFRSPCACANGVYMCEMLMLRASSSVVRFGKTVMNKFKKGRSHGDSSQARLFPHSTGSSSSMDHVQTRAHAFSEADMTGAATHHKHHTNHLYVGDLQHVSMPHAHKTQAQAKSTSPSHSIKVTRWDDGPATAPPSRHDVQSSVELSQDQSRDYSSKFRRLSHQVSYMPACLDKVLLPIPIGELDQEELEQKLHHAFASDSYLLDAPCADEEEETKGNTEVTELEQESLAQRIMGSNFVRKTIHFVRSHPTLLTLIYIAFTGIVEGIIFFDIITDLVVASALYRANYIPAFVLSMILIITPYFIAWASVWTLIDKKREQIGKEGNEKHILFRNRFRYELFRGLFSVAPIGVIMLLLFDCWNVFEFIVVRPLWFGGTQKLFRADTFEELGYRKLRRVSEVCSETIFQAFVQLYIILSINANEAEGVDVGIDEFAVTSSFLSSLFVIVLWFETGWRPQL